ncbi:uncharacterized protein [Parasteatoda tepidariorum]|uniref:uncharacterized protein n=1 Tax=Parasteatoda tepidariorum TaxID=114398 RepID=UPI00077F883A|nr:uncharacterized protein LOC107442302 [Parasteatoda tepidariorum]
MFISLLLLYVIGMANEIVKGQLHAKETKIDTSDGYCNTEEYGKIPIRGTGYSDPKKGCKIAACYDGRLFEKSCGKFSVKASCRMMEGGPGHFPDCCPKPYCPKDESGRNYINIH